MNDGELAQAAAKGDETAAREIVRKYGRLVRGLVTRCARRDRHLLDDLEQDAWLTIFRTLDRYDPAIATLSTWIGVLAKRTATAHNVRSRLDRDRSTIPLELERGDEAGDRYPNLLELQPSREPDPYEMIERVEERRMVEAARSRLSPKQARVVDLYLAGVDPGETRRRLVCTRENVNYLLHRAGEKIRAALPYLRRSVVTGTYAIPAMLPN